MRSTDFVHSYFDAWNHNDPKAIADHLTQGGVYWDIPANAKSNHDQLIDRLEAYFESHEHRYELSGEILTGTETVAFEYRILPCAQSGVYEAVLGSEFITLNEDGALSITDYYDARMETTVRPAQRGVQEIKYAKSGLGDEQLDRYKSRLERVMRDEQIYLQPDLTLPKLAAVVQCSVNHLSQVINAGFGMSFFDYVNRYRINHAQDLLMADGGQEAVLNVAFAVGFNSNSAFYAAFKKCLGQTPAQYRRARLPNA